MTWRSAAFESRSKTWSKPTLDRNKGEKSKAVLIATSSAERHGYEGRPKSGRPLGLPDPIRRPTAVELGIGGAGVKRGEALRCEWLRLRWRPREGVRLTPAR